MYSATTDLNTHGRKIVISLRDVCIGVRACILTLVDVCVCVQVDTWPKSPSSMWRVGCGLQVELVRHQTGPRRSLPSVCCRDCARSCRLFVRVCMYVDMYRKERLNRDYVRFRVM